MTNQARFEITDWRTVCSELIDALDSGVPAGRIRLSPLARRARAALAEPVGEGPTDEELKAAYWKAYRQNTIRDNEECFLAALRAIYRWDRPALAEPEPAPPAAGGVVGPEWRPCVKLPITVHVREQRPGETHVSTREGITPVRPDDLIMRGVQGEEYPIGRELFEKTYRLGPAEPAPPAEDVLTDKELDALMPQQMRSDLEAAVVARSADLGFDKAIGICRFSVYKKARAYARAAIAADRARYSHQPAPPAEVAPGPTMEDVGPLIAWLTEQAHQAADASQPTDAGMLTWAAQVIGERVDEDAPAPSAAGEPSDENCWQWYTYCPEEGLEMYSDRKQAQSAAQSIMGSYEVAAHSDGWHEDMESVSWGMLVPVEQAQVVERKTADPDSEFDEWVKYELRPARYGNQPAPPAAACGGGEEIDCETCNGLGTIDERLGGYGDSNPAATCPDCDGIGVIVVSAPSPEKGLSDEVGELIKCLRIRAASLSEVGANLSQQGDAIYFTRAADLLAQRHSAPVPVAERLQQLEDLAADAVSGLRYIEQTHGRLYGVGWDRVYEKADRLQPGHALPLPAGEVQP